MPDIANQTISAPNTKNWKDNLLLKDENGLLSYYKNKGNTSSQAAALTNTTSSDQATIEKKALVDANFSGNNSGNLQGKSSDKADFYFHPEDKKDLESLAKSVPKDDSKKYSVEKITAKIIEKQNLDLDSENRQKFNDILFNFLRSRKNSISTRQFINEKIKSGGRVLPERSIDSVMSVIKGIKEKIIAAGGLVVWEAQMPADSLPKDDKVELKPIILEEEDSAAEPQAEIDKALAGLSEGEDKKDQQKLAENKAVKPLELNKDEPLSEKETSFASVKTEEKPVEISQSKTEEKPPVESKKDITDKEEKRDRDFSIPQEDNNEKKTLASESNLPRVLRPSNAPTASTRKQMSDVLPKIAPKIENKIPQAALTGPVQEIQSLDLLNFRRLGQSSQERADKILGKINLLEQDSFTKKAQGVAAWRNSPLHQLYLSLGAQSMAQGQSIEEFLTQKKAEDEKHMDIEEFSAISDLNRQLRF